MRASWSGAAGLAVVGTASYLAAGGPGAADMGGVAIALGVAAAAVCIPVAAWVGLNELRGADYTQGGGMPVLVAVCALAGTLAAWALAPHLLWTGLELAAWVVGAAVAAAPVWAVGRAEAGRRQEGRVRAGGAAL